MRPQALWQLSVTTSSEAEEAVAQLLERLFQQPPSVCLMAGKATPVISVFLSDRRDWSQLQRRWLLAGLQRIARAGLKVEPATTICRRLSPTNWAESWKRHFRPLEIGRALLIKPSWSRRRPRRGQAAVVLDPGLSFGTGHHPTTLFCLRKLLVCRQGGQRQAFLDLGTGSGILAIAAAKLGYEPVHALDVDPEAVRVAETNAAANGVGKRIRFDCRDLCHLSAHGARRYSVICANLTSDLLLREMERIVNRVKPGGALVLAGILAEEFESVRERCETVGMSMIDRQQRGEWCSGAFTL